MLDALSNKVARVGFFPSAKYDDGTPVAYVATIQEFGSPAQGIPPRPFMRTTVAERESVWVRIAKQGARAVVKGSATGEQVLDMIAQQAAGDIRKTISDLTSPPLKPATIAARLRERADKVTVGKLTKPLIDTALLYDSVTYEVGDK